MSLQRSFERAAQRKLGEPWPKGQVIDKRNEGLAEVGLHLHPTKGFRSRSAWRDDAARKAAKSRRGKPMFRALLSVIFGRQL